MLTEAMAVMATKWEREAWLIKKKDWQDKMLEYATIVKLTNYVNRRSAGKGSRETILTIINK